jgi:uncharacterized membrane protein YphA (DoxX/SURF4 family)
MIALLQLCKRSSIFKIKMETFLTVVSIALKLIIGLSILNVWLLNRNKASEWRGGNADNMEEEFAAYGLPKTAMYLVGFLKCLFAVLLLVSIVHHPLTDVSAYAIAILMAGAIIMHARIGDDKKKSLPAFTLMALSIIVTFL